MNKKHFFLSIFLIIVFLFSSAGLCFAEEDLLSGLNDLDLSDFTIGKIFVPAQSDYASDYLALQLLALSCGTTDAVTEQLFQSAGIEILEQTHYDRTADNVSDTCAFTIGEGEVLQNLMFSKKAIFVSIRGSVREDLYSDFDFCPSHNDKTLFSENFLFCAEDVFLSLKKYLDPEEDPIIIICGYGRGAGCANLLGVLVNEYVSPDRVYVYTYACPATIREDSGLPAYENIFNYINPCDLFTKMPFSQWGFVRAGIDVILEEKDPELAEQEDSYTETWSRIAPTVRSYYEDKHSLTDPGLDEDGLSLFEITLLIYYMLLSLDPDDISLDSDGISLPEQFSEYLGSETGFLSEDSDLYPISGFISDLTGQDQEQSYTMILQHLPNIYLQLIEERLMTE